RFEFTHDRIREVAYGELMPPRRKLLHGSVAATLETLSANALEPPYAALGFHYREGEIWDKAVNYLHRAADQAIARSASREVVAHVEQALTAARHLEQTRERITELVDLRLQLWQSLRRLGEFERGRACLREAERLARNLEDPRRLAWVWAYLSE